MTRASGTSIGRQSQWDISGTSIGRQSQWDISGTSIGRQSQWDISGTSPWAIKRASSRLLPCRLRIVSPHHHTVFHRSHETSKFRVCAWSETCKGRVGRGGVHRRGSGERASVVPSAVPRRRGGAGKTRCDVGNWPKSPNFNFSQNRKLFDPVRNRKHRVYKNFIKISGGECVPPPNTPFLLYTGLPESATANSTI